MKRFVRATLDDMRNGRDSWRVIVATAAPALFLSLLIAALR